MTNKYYTWTQNISSLHGPIERRCLAPMACVEFTQSSSSIAIVGSSVQVGTGKLTLPARYAPRVQIMVSHDLRTLEQ
jgi:hypothetical protein